MLSCMLWCGHNADSSGLLLLQPLLYSSTSRFTVTGQKSGVRGQGGALPTVMQVHYSAPFSCSTHTHPPGQSIKSGDQQTPSLHTDTHTNTGIHVHLMSWPLCGPHVVGVFSYGAGDGSEESEQRCRPGDKGRVAPGLERRKLRVRPRDLQVLQKPP